MKPSEVRERVLKDHVDISGMIDHLEVIAREVIAGDRQLIGPVRVAGETLLEVLETHMHWEDVYLAPALRAADAWGEERARALEDDHREQRELLRHTLAGIQDQSRPAVVLARCMVDLVELLREDIREEEESLLDPRVLRDDVISIGANTG